MLRRFLIGLIILPFLGGLTLQAMPASKAADTLAAVPAMDCIHMTMPGQGSAAGKSVPCETNNADCLKQMVCFGPLALPTRSGEHLPVTYLLVTYWSPDSSGTGRLLAPEPFPPIAS